MSVYDCPDCAKTTAGDCGKHGVFTAPTDPQKGWECPRCGAINAPTVAQCPCSIERFKYGQLTFKGSPSSSAEISWWRS